MDAVGVGRQAEKDVGVGGEGQGRVGEGPAEKDAPAGQGVDRRRRDGLRRRSSPRRSARRVSTVTRRMLGLAGSGRGERHRDEAGQPRAAKSGEIAAPAVGMSA